jgi:hypothetical protein
VSDLVGDALRRSTAEPTRLNRILELLERSGIDPEEVARLEKVRIGEHQVPVKLRDEHGVERVEVITATADSLVVIPTWAESGPAWPVVQPAAPVKIPASRAHPVDDDLVRAVFLPDTQCGGWLVDGDIIPMHDLAAMTVAVEIVRQVRPDVVVMLGDLVDLAAMSLKFARTPTMAQLTQFAIDEAYQWLAQVRAAAPNATVHLLAGNHDDRLPRYIAANAAEAFGLRRASTPDSWPVMSLGNLLRLDDLDINWVQGYSAGRVWLREGLPGIVAHHGKHVSPSKQARDRLIASTFQGHNHRLEVATRTHEGAYGAPLHTMHVSCGTLARIDGVVPSFHSATDDAGVPVPQTEDWTQGVVVATWAPDPGTLPAVELVPIHDGSAWFRGKHLTVNQ